MNLNGIPSYVIRSYLFLLSKVRHSDHPNLTTLVLKAATEHKVSGRELLTKETIEALGKYPVAALWRRVTVTEDISPIPPCPEAERLPYDDGKPLQK